MSDAATHRVSVKLVGKQRGEWLGMNGRTTRLLIHAIETTQERAETLAAELEEMNPGVVEFAQARAIA
jgi:hypothetical protein